MNDIEMNEVVAKIGEASHSLNQAAEEATQMIEALDAKLVSVDPGVTVWGEVLSSEKINFQNSDSKMVEPAQRVVTVGFAKAKKKKWGLCLKEEIAGKKGLILEQEVTLLRKADRRMRLQALPHLGALLASILHELEASVEKIRSLMPEPSTDPATEIAVEPVAGLSVDGAAVASA